MSELKKKKKTGEQTISRKLTRQRERFQLEHPRLTIKTQKTLQILKEPYFSCPLRTAVTQANRQSTVHRQTQHISVHIHSLSNKSNHKKTSFRLSKNDTAQCVLSLTVPRESDSVTDPPLTYILPSKTNNCL